jgi:hypothetical protein
LLIIDKIKNLPIILKMKVNKRMKEQAIPNHRRRKGKKVKRNIDSGTHNQTLKQQR